MDTPLNSQRIEDESVAYGLYLAAISSGVHVNAEDTRDIKFVGAWIDGDGFTWTKTAGHDKDGEDWNGWTVRDPDGEFVGFTRDLNDPPK